MATIKKESIISIVVDGKGKDFEKSGLRDLDILELHTRFLTPVGGEPLTKDATIADWDSTAVIRYTDFIDPYWWDSTHYDPFHSYSEADAIRKEKGDVIVSFRRGKDMCLPGCLFEARIRKNRRLKDVLEREVIRHFTSHQKLREKGAVPVSFDIFEISSISEAEVRGTLVRYEWRLPHCNYSTIVDKVRYWAYGRPARKEQQEYCIKFVNCPITA